MIAGKPDPLTRLMLWCVAQVKARYQARERTGEVIGPTTPLSTREQKAVVVELALASSRPVSDQELAAMLAAMTPSRSKRNRAALH